MKKRFLLIILSLLSLNTFAQYTAVNGEANISININDPLLHDEISAHFSVDVEITSSLENLNEVNLRRLKLDVIERLFVDDNDDGALSLKFTSIGYERHNNQLTESEVYKLEMIRLANFEIIKAWRVEDKTIVTFKADLGLGFQVNGMSKLNNIDLSQDELEIVQSVNNCPDCRLGRALKSHLTLPRTVALEFKINHAQTYLRLYGDYARVGDFNNLSDESDFGIVGHWEKRDLYRGGLELGVSLRDHPVDLYGRVQYNRLEAKYTFAERESGYTNLWELPDTYHRPAKDLLLIEAGLRIRLFDKKSKKRKLKF